MQCYCILILSEASKNIQRGSPDFLGGRAGNFDPTGGVVTGPCIALKMEGGNNYLLQNLESDDIKCDMYMKVWSKFNLCFLHLPQPILVRGGSH